jgi:4-diphosphocytidyl-2-C-methyl-D-erythritol kinase
VSRSVTLRAPAKVNLHLGVGALRPDGYHDVTTVLAALEFGDTVTVTEAPVLSLDRDPEPPFDPSSDLCWRAAEALAREIGRPPGLAIRLEKRIPIAAGLGGGSSDAAAVLVGAARLWGIPEGDLALERVAASLGSDVPFFLAGGCALYRGRGDEFVRSIASPVLQVVLVNPGVPAPTGAVYAAFDRLPRPVPLDPGPLEGALVGGDPAAVAAMLENDLSFLAGRPGVLGALVAGSGSTVFGIARDAACAAGAADAARRVGWWAWPTSTAAGGVA